MTEGSIFMMRTTTTLGVAALLGAALIPTSAEAQVTQRGFAVNKFEPAERGSEWFASESLDYRGKVRPAVGVVGDYSYRSLLIFAPDGDVRGSVVRNAFYLHPGASLALFERLRLAVSLPVQSVVDGRSATITHDGVTSRFAAPPKDDGVGDLRFGADVRLFGVHGGRATMALGAQFWAPTGMTAQFAGDGSWRIKPRLMVAGTIR
ncbi:MAG TPA: hypothetical protein VM580_22235, partial [Labilithrix sp.]|nr:hypothetical protein [Labilithrix sp.]